MITRLLLPILLAAAIAALVIVGIGQLGGSTSSARTEREVVNASDGLVQSTVTGTGNVEPVTEDDVDFQTSGTLSHVYVREGEHVSKGQLLATLDDATDVLELKEARATLSEARTTLTGDETKLADTDSSTTDTTDTADVDESAASTVDVDDDLGSPTTTSTDSATTPTRTTPTRTTTTTTTTTAPTATTTTATTTTPETTTGTTRTSGTGDTSTSGSSDSAGSSGASRSSGSSSSSGSTSSSSTVTAATVDSDKLTVDQDEAAVKEDEQSVSENRLTAPASGTVTSLESISPGDSVTAGSTSSSSDASAGSSDDSDATSSTAAGAGGSDDAASSTSSDSSTSTSFATIDSLRSLSMTVSFTEADISKLRVGQPATVTLDALSGVELAGKVTAVSSLGTTDDDVVSYDATITLDQYDSSVKPGMSASADVIVKSEHGVTVPSAAVTGTGTLASVTEQVDGKDETKKVIVGLRGTDEDLVVSGVSSGAQLVETETLPATGASSTSSSSASTGTGSERGFGSGAGGGFTGGAGGGFGGGAGGGFAGGGR